VDTDDTFGYDTHIRFDLLNLMISAAIFASVKDWADLIHAVAWPLVVLLIVWRFRKSIDHIGAAFLKIPWEKVSSVKAANVELSISEATLVNETTIPVPAVPVANPVAAGEEDRGA
jgi:hypothetical protein